MALCEYCFSSNMAQHREGYTCLECSRVSEDLYFGDSPSVKIEYSDTSPSNDTNCVLSEIAFRIGIPDLLLSKIKHLSNQARNYFKTSSRVDLMLLAIYQGFLEDRSFISLSKLKYFYITNSSVTTLNNMHFKMVENDIFKLSQEFSFSEISLSLIQYFRFSNEYYILMNKYFTIFNNHMKHVTPSLVIGCLCYYLRTGNIINNNTSLFDIYIYLGVKKSTVMTKIRLLKKNGVI
jgi:hypothetical protein